MFILFGGKTRQPNRLRSIIGFLTVFTQGFPRWNQLIDYKSSIQTRLYNFFASRGLIYGRSPHTNLTCDLIQDVLCCEVIVVVPFVDAVCEEAQSNGMQVSSLSDLKELISH